LGQDKRMSKNWQTINLRQLRKLAQQNEPMNLNEMHWMVQVEDEFESSNKHVNTISMVEKTQDKQEQVWNNTKIEEGSRT